jgi:HD superfamily phosphohydrolase
MSKEKKVIRDPIHGDIKFVGLVLDLIQAPELQRLYNIKQLGFAHLVFPGAHHTRLEHSLGTYFMALKVSEVLDLEDCDKEEFICAALLHDIGHGPFSHTLEFVLRELLNVDHVDLTEKLILGKHTIFNEKESHLIASENVVNILDNYGINKNEIIDIIKGNKLEKTYLCQLLNAPIDVDQLDYLVRDAYYTGVSYGLIDIDRYLQTLIINNNQLAVKKKGVGVIENILIARTLMYSSVYFHKTIRIAEIMLSKAIELLDKIDPYELFKLTDGELLNDLKKRDDYQYEIVTRIKFRNLFKQAFSASKEDLKAKDSSIMEKLENRSFRRQKEEELEESLRIPKGHVIIDIPHQDLFQAEPRIYKTDISIVDGNNVKKLDDFTPIAEAVKTRQIPDWTIMIVTDDKYRDIVSKKAEKILFS